MGCIDCKVKGRIGKVEWKFAWYWYEKEHWSNTLPLRETFIAFNIEYSSFTLFIGFSKTNSSEPDKQFRTWNLLFNQVQ